MKQHTIKYLLHILFASFVFAGCRSTDSDTTVPVIHWDSHAMAPNGRIDAIADLGNGIVMAGTRDDLPGHLYRSEDCGETWVDLGQITDGDRITGSISSIAGDGSGTAYFLTGAGEVWKSSDFGLTWRSLGQVSNMRAHWHFLHSYSITVSHIGTVLVSNTYPGGGHIFRSEDGGLSWQNVGSIGKAALYRFEKLDDALLVNGWSGHIYKSDDDGKSWRHLDQLADSALYATDYLGRNIVLQGAEDGRIFRSEDNGESWSEVATFPESGDDFVNFGDGVVIYTTYNGEKNLYQSNDYGLTWRSIGVLPTTEDDNLEHVVPVRCGNAIRAVGGTKRGYIVWSDGIISGN